MEGHSYDSIDNSVQRNMPLEPVKKAPRKPRPSEIAAKLAKAAGKKKPKAKPKSKARAAWDSRPVTRPCRFDMRLTKAEKDKLKRHAKKAQCSVTRVVLDLIAKLK